MAILKNTEPSLDTIAPIISKNVNCSENVDESVEKIESPRYANKNASAAYENVLIQITLPNFDSSEIL